MSDPDPVLSVPAFSYSEVAQQQRDRAETAKASRSTRRLGGSARAAKKATVTGAAQPAAAKKPKRGEVGRQIVVAVDAKVAPGTSRSDAFKAVAGERGMTAGAVSANYYRVRRSQKPKPARRPATPGTGSRRARSTAQPRVAASTRRRSAAPDSGVDRAAADLVSAIRAVADAAHSQAAQVSQLRAQLDELRSLLAQSPEPD